MGIIQKIEAAQTAICKEEVLIESLKSQVWSAVKEYLPKIACVPKENITSHDISGVETKNNELLFTVIVYFARNPAVKNQRFSEEITLVIPEIYFDYLTIPTTDRVLFTETESNNLSEFIEYQITERFLTKFVIPNINRILAEG